MDDATIFSAWQISTELLRPYKIALPLLILLLPYHPLISFFEFCIVIDSYETSIVAFTTQYCVDFLK